MTAQITLPDGTLVLFDQDDVEMVLGHRWHRSGGEAKYAGTRCMKNGKMTTAYMHRLISGAIDGDIVDHINGNTFDNRRTNLRKVDPSESAQNKHGPKKPHALGARGVYWRSDVGKFCALVQVRHKKHYLGLYATLEEADEVAKAGRARLMTHSSECADEVTS